MDTLLSLDDVAARLGKTRDWVYRQCLRGAMPHRRIGNRRALTEADLTEYLDRVRSADPWQRSAQSRARRRTA